MRTSTIAVIATALVAAPAAFAAPISKGLTPRAELNARGSIEDAIVAELDKLFGQRLHRKSAPNASKRMFVPAGGIPRPTSGKREDALFADQVIDDGSDDSDEVVESSPEDAEDPVDDGSAEADVTTAEGASEDQDLVEKRLFGAEGFLLPSAKNSKRASMKSRIVYRSHGSSSSSSSSSSSPGSSTPSSSSSGSSSPRNEDVTEKRSHGSSSSSSSSSSSPGSSTSSSSSSGSSSPRNEDVIEKRLFGSDTFLLPGSKPSKRSDEIIDDDSAEDDDAEDDHSDDDEEDTDAEEQVVEKRLFGSDTFLLPGSKPSRRASMKSRMIDELD